MRAEFIVAARGSREAGKARLFFVENAEGTQFQTWDASNVADIHEGDLIAVEYEIKEREMQGRDGMMRKFVNYQFKTPVEYLGGERVSGAVPTPAADEGISLLEASQALPEPPTPGYAQVNPDQARQDSIMRQTAGKCAVELLANLYTGTGKEIEHAQVIELMQFFFSYFKHGAVAPGDDGIPF